MQRGKCMERESMDEAEMAVSREVSESEMPESGVEKFLDRWFRIGVRRSSSSSRGMARAVI